MRIFQLLFIAICIIVFSLSAPVSVMAQTTNEPTGYQQVTLFLQPEYDAPGLLVMLQGQIVGAQAPATVKFLVPTAASMNSAGSMDSAGNYSRGNYPPGGGPPRVPSAIPGWDEISYEVTTQTFRVEYYAPSIIGYPDKTISYEFIPEYPITNLYVHIQQPASSTNFIVSPAGQLSADNQGYNLYTYTVPSMKAQDTLSYTISYTKTDTRFSTDINPTGGINFGGNSNPLPNGNSSSTPLIITPVAAGIVLMAVLLIRRRKLILKSRRRQSTKSKSESNRKGSQTATGFCRKCGKQIEGPFLFCPHCGTKRAGKKGASPV